MIRELHQLCSLYTADYPTPSLHSNSCRVTLPYSYEPDRYSPPASLCRTVTNPVDSARSREHPATMFNKSIAPTRLYSYENGINNICPRHATVQLRTQINSNHPACTVMKTGSIPSAGRHSKN